MIDELGINADFTVAQALIATADLLSKTSDKSPEISAKWLVGHAISKDPGQLLLVADLPITQEGLSRLLDGIKARQEGQPLQYICKHAPFRKLDLISRPGVFIPRPETEILVELALDSIKDLYAQKGDDILIADLCCGSGSICVSILYEFDHCRAIATDISKQACDLTLENAELAGVLDRIEVLRGDLLDPLNTRDVRVDAIISNPPYIPSKKLEEMPKEVVDFEPIAALDGGADGLDTYRRLLKQARKILMPGGFMAFELDEDMLSLAASLMGDCHWVDQDSVRVIKDLAGRDRAIFARSIAY